MNNILVGVRNLKEVLTGILATCFALTGSVQAIAQIDADATCETRNLYANLKHLAPDHVIFGHQNTVISGVGWKSDDAAEFRSDVQLAVGEFPGVYGFDFHEGMET